jgi:RNA polymerase sigma-70 factor (ECF subfamily)
VPAAGSEGESELRAAFISRLNGPIDAPIDAPIQTALARIAADVQASHPTLAYSFADFGARLAERIAASDTNALATLRGADLYLALACASGDARALEAFESTYGAGLDKTLARFANKAAQLDDLRQLVRSKLFVGEGAPKITQYSGQGDLRVWLRVMATRTALNALRGPTSEELDDHLVATIVDPTDSPELLHMKSLYREEFKAAFGAALADLSPRQKSLLRFAVLNGLDGGKIGAIYKVHRTTASRWIDEARLELSQRTMKILSERLQVPKAEIESILQVIRSNLELSLERCLEDA